MFYWFWYYKYTSFQNLLVIYYFPPIKVTFRFQDEESINTNPLWNQTFDYEIVSDDTFKWLHLRNDIIDETLLMLLSDKFIILYSKSSNNPVFWGTQSVRSWEFYSPVHVLGASSELHEGEKIYSASNVENSHLDEPWVEAQDGLGIGESITMHIDVTYLFFITGYVSARKPYLWSYNSRPKEIMCYFPNTNETYSFVLEDSPNPQMIEFPERKSGTVIITIQDVYPGTKWEDTCIHWVFGEIF